MQEFVEGQQWTFAKTMPEWPHEYIIRGKGNDPDRFDLFQYSCWWHGTLRVWGGYQKAHIYWHDKDDMRYWAGWPIASSRIVNRVFPKDDTSVVPPEGFQPRLWNTQDGKMPNI